MTVYFAYGSNLSREQMAQRCPGARGLGAGVLRGHRFLINRRGVATVVPDEMREVHGLLWSLTAADEASLDGYEGVAYGTYAKAYLPLDDAEGLPIEALVYVARDAEPGSPKPGYLEKILAAAVAHRLPPPYLEELRGLAMRRTEG